MALASAIRAAAILFLFLSVGMLSLCAPMQAGGNRIEALHAEAKTAEAGGDLATAIAKYREILKLDPQLAPAYNNLGALYFKQGDFRDAAGTLERGLKINPHMRSASALLGMSLFQMSEYRKARPSLEAAVKENPSDVNAEFFLVNDLTKLSDFRGAAAHLRRIASIEPNDQHAWYLLGKVYMQLAQQALGNVKRINPDSVWAHEISAEMMESMKNYAGAIVEWKKAIATAPRQPGVHFKLGDLYWSHSEWDKATAQFEMEKQIDPKDCLVDWKLGDILMRKGVQPEQALDLENKSLAVCPALFDARTDRARWLLRLHRYQEAIPELK
ncbi:MAG: tetratricopeptide repeat protein, partial [Bryobacteraceae bacterium]